MENREKDIEPIPISKGDFCRFCHMLYQRHLVGGVGGNMAARSGKDIFLTPSGCSLRNIEPDSIVTMLSEGEVSGKGTPTKDAASHLRIMKTRPDINVSLHLHGAHIIAASALLNPGIDSLPPLTPGFVYFAYPLTMMPFLVPGTDELAEAVEKVFKDRSSKAVLLQNHGLITIGSDFDDAFNAAEEIDEAAKIFLLTAGRAKPIPMEDINRIKTIPLQSGMVRGH